MHKCTRFAEDEKPISLPGPPFAKLHPAQVLHCWILQAPGPGRPRAPTYRSGAVPVQEKQRPPEAMDAQRQDVAPVPRCLIRSPETPLLFQIRATPLESPC
jgi:hypothetical protein